MSESKKPETTLEAIEAFVDAMRAFGRALLDTAPGRVVRRATEWLNRKLGKHD